MKTLSVPQLFIHRSCQIRTLVVLSLLFASIGLVQAQWTVFPGTNEFNVYTYSPVNGIDGSSGASSTDPAAQGMPLPTYEYMTYGTAMPVGNSFTYSDLYDSVNFVGSNPMAIGTSLNVTYAGAGQAELRVDWMGNYQNTSGGPLTLPAAFSINIQGLDNVYAAVAGQEMFLGPAGAFTVTIPSLGGPFPMPNGPWYGTTTPGTYNLTDNTFNAAGNYPQIIGNGGTVEVYGYLDLVVDPGTITVEITPVPEPGVSALSLLGGLGLFCYRRIRNRRK
jgi:hypothetical protein